MRDSNLIFQILIHYSAQDNSPFYKVINYLSYGILNQVKILTIEVYENQKLYFSNILQIIWEQGLFYARILNMHRFSFMAYNFVIIVPKVDKWFLIIC